MRATRPPRLIPLAADLHLHSALSPCGDERMVPGELVNRLYSIGLGVEVFSITDHNAGANCPAFAAAARARNLLFIPGIELQSSEEIHLLGYLPDLAALEAFCRQVADRGLMKGQVNDPARFGSQLKLDLDGEIAGEETAMLSMPLTLGVDELVNRIHEHGGIAVAAHLDRAFSVVSQLGFIPPQLELDAVEVRDPGKVEEVRAKYLRGRELNILCSSDSHHLDLVPKPRMKLWVERADVASCLECLGGAGPGRITLRQERPKAGAGEAGTGGYKDAPWS